VQVQSGTQQACEEGRKGGREGGRERNEIGDRFRPVGEWEGKRGERKRSACLPKGLRMALTLEVMVSVRAMPTALVGVEVEGEPNPPRLSFREEGVCREAAARGV
jgi:hypothetical protein